MAFQGFLRQSTAVDILLGPFLDEDDGKTAETGLTLSQGDIKLSKNGQALAQKTDATAAAADANGYYNCELDATDTNTVGQLTIICHESGALPVRLDYHVVEEAVYDAMYAGSAAGPLQSTTAGRTLDVNATGEAGLDLDNTSGTLDADQLGADCITSAKIADDAIAAEHLATGALTADAFAANALVDATFAAASLNGKGDWNTTKTGYALSSTGADAILKDSTFALAMADAVWDELLAGHTTADTAGLVLNEWQDGGRLDLILDAILADTNELQTDDIPGTLTTIAAYLDTEIAAILEDTGTTLPAAIATVLAMLDDPRAEPGQGAPAVNADAMTKLDYLYKAWRNKSTQTATEYDLYDDAGTTVDQKATVSDDATTATKGEIATGP